MTLLLLQFCQENHVQIYLPGFITNYVVPDQCLYECCYFYFHLYKYFPRNFIFTNYNFKSEKEKYTVTNREKVITK